MSKSLPKKVMLFTILTGGHGELHASLLPYFSSIVLRVDICVIVGSIG